jgi:hypothetical protein
MYNDPEWASEEEWDAYAWFGFAISEAQLVERQLLLIAVAVKSAEAVPGQSENLWFELRDNLGRFTLGQLRRYLEPYGVLPNDLLDMLNRSIDTRNALAHEFFVPRTANGGERSPRMAKKELQKAASLFSNLSTRLDLVLWPLFERLHVQRDDLEQETDRLLSFEDTQPTE